jgi:hypothetical protein
MSIYVVRCNFNDPDELERWHHWYSGEHKARLLTVPGFSSLQRYEAVDLDKSVRFMAVWSIDGPEVLQSEMYKSVAGGSWPEQWRQSISESTRTVYEEIAD